MKISDEHNDNTSNGQVPGREDLHRWADHLLYTLREDALDQAFSPSQEAQDGLLLMLEVGGPIPSHDENEFSDKDFIALLRKRGKE